MVGGGRTGTSTPGPWLLGEAGSAVGARGEPVGLLIGGLAASEQCDELCGHGLPLRSSCSSCQLWPRVPRVCSAAVTVLQVGPARGSDRGVLQPEVSDKPEGKWGLYQLQS